MVQQKIQWFFNDSLRVLLFITGLCGIGILIVKTMLRIREDKKRKIWER